MIDKIFDQHRLEVSIISCGDTGQEIGGKISKTLRDHGAIVKAMTVTSSLEKDHDDDGFDSHVWIDEKNDGFLGDTRGLAINITSTSKHKSTITISSAI